MQGEGEKRRRRRSVIHREGAGRRPRRRTKARDAGLLQGGPDSYEAGRAGGGTPGREEQVGSSAVGGLGRELKRNIIRQALDHGCGGRGRMRARSCSSCIASPAGRGSSILASYRWRAVTQGRSAGAPSRRPGNEPPAAGPGRGCLAGLAGCGHGTASGANLDVHDGGLCCGLPMSRPGQRRRSPGPASGTS